MSNPARVTLRDVKSRRVFAWDANTDPSVGIGIVSESSEK